MQITIDDTVELNLAAANIAGKLRVHPHEPAAGNGSFGRECEVEQFAAVAIESGRSRCTTGDKQFIAIDQQVSLRRESSQRFGAHVRLLAIQCSAAIVDPFDLARPGVERVDKDALQRPDSGSEIEGLVGQHRTPADRPDRNQPAIAQEFPS